MAVFDQMADSREQKHEARLMKRDVMHYYKKEKKNLKERCFTELYNFYDHIGVSKPVDPPRRHVLEEVGNAVSHGVGAVLALIGLAVMLSRSHTASSRMNALIYSLGLFGVFFSSCIYHALGYGSRAKRIARRFDYASVYLIIAATFLPIALSIIPGRGAIPFLAVQWTVILLGVVSVAVFGPERLYALHIAFYLVLGWSSLLLLPRMYAVDPIFASRILGGGVLITLGVIPCAMKWNGAHFVFHLFVLSGVIVQWSGMFEFLYP